MPQKKSYLFGVFVRTAFELYKKFEIKKSDFKRLIYSSRAPLFYKMETKIGAF
jgi:hypothetical protein